MEKNIPIRARVKSIEFGDKPIDLDGYDLFKSKSNKQPYKLYTLENDEIFIRQEPYEKDEIRVNELKTPLEVDFNSSAITFQGTFICKGQREESGYPSPFADLYSGPTSYNHNSQINTSILITLWDGSLIFIPNARGYIRMDLKLGKGGMFKFPFYFECLEEGNGVAIDFPDKRPTGVSGGSVNTSPDPEETGSGDTGI